MCKFRFELPVALTAAACLFGCEIDPQEYRFSENISGIQFEFFDDDEGVHPSQVVLLNPRNPFRDFSIGSETKWDILSGGGNAGAFYAWATILAREPNGEHQFYTASKLRDVYDANEVEGEEREKVRLLAIKGFQTMLDEFPDALTFDVTGTTGFRLATPAYLAIIALNGAPKGDWVLLEDSNGNPVVVKGAGLDTPRPGQEDD